VRPSERARRLRSLAEEYRSQDRPLQPVSSETGENLPQLALLVKERLTSRAPRAKTPTALQET